jgi:hypothetical protein
MSGIISGIDYSVLFSGTSSASDTASSMLATLYSGATASSGTAVSSGNSILDLKLAEQNQTAEIAKEGKNPIVVRDLAAFTKGVVSAKNLNTALQNPDVLKVLLTANGMADQMQYTALATKVLQSDPTDPNSLVNKLSDPRWKTLATTYNLATKGLAGLQDPTARSQLANAYERVTWLNSLDKATPGLAQAMQFKQQASKITSVDQILGDPINWEVVLTALGIPQQIAFQSMSAQEQAVSRRLDIKKLQDTNFVNNLTDQYLLSKRQQSQSTSATPSLDSLAAQVAGLVV